MTLITNSPNFNIGTALYKSIPLLKVDDEGNTFAVANVVTLYVSGIRLCKFDHGTGRCEYEYCLISFQDFIKETRINDKWQNADSFTMSKTLASVQAKLEADQLNLKIKKERRKIWLNKLFWWPKNWKRLPQMMKERRFF